MVSRKQEKGQSLVELALVLPCFCFGILMAVLLICFCHNMMEIQRMSQVTIDRQQEDFRADARNYWRFHGLWGRPWLDAMRPPARIPMPWRAHKGFNTLAISGAYVQVQVGARLLPVTGFGRTLVPPAQISYARTYFEPPVPRSE